MRGIETLVLNMLINVFVHFVSSNGWFCCQRRVVIQTMIGYYPKTMNKNRGDVLLLE